MTIGLGDNVADPHLLGLAGTPGDGAGAGAAAPSHDVDSRVGSVAGLILPQDNEDGLGPDMFALEHQVSVLTDSELRASPGSSSGTVAGESESKEAAPLLPGVEFVPLGDSASGPVTLHLVGDPGDDTPPSAAPPAPPPAEPAPSDSAESVVMTPVPEDEPEEKVKAAGADPGEVAKLRKGLENANVRIGKLEAEQRVAKQVSQQTNRARMCAVAMLVCIAVAAVIFTGGLAAVPMIGAMGIMGGVSMVTTGAMFMFGAMYYEATSSERLAVKNNINKTVEELKGLDPAEKKKFTDWIENVVTHYRPLRQEDEEKDKKRVAEERESLAHDPEMYYIYKHMKQDVKDKKEDNWPSEIFLDWTKKQIALMRSYNLVPHNYKPPNKWPVVGSVPLVHSENNDENTVAGRNFEVMRKALGLTPPPSPPPAAAPAGAGTPASSSSAPAPAPSPASEPPEAEVKRRASAA